MERELIFNGISSLQIGLIVDGYFSRGVANRRVTRKSIPGHNGDYLMDEGAYDNLDESYDIYWLAGVNSQENDLIFQEIVNWLKQDRYYRLEDSEFPGYFWMAKTSGITRRDVVNYRDCYFGAPLVFNRKPQCYSIEGENPISISSGSILTNPLDEISEPLITFTLADAGTLTINGKTNEFFGFSGDVTVDSEPEFCYSGTTNLSNHMTGVFPKLQPGENTIAFSGGISNLKVVPRWWTR